MTGVPTILLEQLAAARRQGVTFAAAWPPALGTAIATARPLERDDWSAVLVGTIDTWRAAFEEQPASRRERALAIVAVDPERVPIGRECARCGGEIPEARRRALYCSPRCKRDANYAREPRAA